MFLSSMSYLNLVSLTAMYSSFQILNRKTSRITLLIRHICLYQVIGLAIESHRKSTLSHMRWCRSFLDVDIYRLHRVALDHREMEYRSLGYSLERLKGYRKYTSASWPTKIKEDMPAKCQTLLSYIAKAPTPGPPHMLIKS